jgi:hypothetical protein
MADAQKPNGTRVPLHAWLYPGKDDDLIATWTGISEGERSNVLKEALAHYYQLPPTKRRNPLARMADDMAKIIKLLEELKALIQQLLSRPAGYHPDNHQSSADPELDRLAQERDENMRKNSW